MANGITSRLMALGVAAAGLALGGPQTLPASSGERVVGATPVAPVPDDCNGNAINDANCASGCGNGPYQLIRPEQAGTTLGTRYNNDQLVCTTNAASPCAKYTLTSSGAACTATKTKISED